MNGTSVEPERAVATIFNSAIAATAISTAWEIGLFSELKSSRKVNAERFALKHDFHVGSVQGLVTALVTVHIVEREPGQDVDHIVPGTLFDEAFRTKSLFHWLSIGSGDLFSRMPYVLRNENRVGDFFTRDAAAIAYACRDINSQYWDPAFWNAMEGLDFSFSSVVDLGCGSGGRLMQVCPYLGKWAPAILSFSTTLMRRLDSQTVSWGQGTWNRYRSTSDQGSLRRWIAMRF